MSNFSSKTLTALFILICASLQAQRLSKTNVVLSAIKGEESRPDTLKILSDKKFRIKNLSIIGTHKDFFKVVSPEPTQMSEVIVIVFQPSSEFIGIARATLQIGGPKLTANLTGLSTKGLEGENEAPLSLVVDALGYKVDLGWNTLANHLRPDLQGEELAPSLFKKAGSGRVEMIPVARYSPDFLLNFGFYTSGSKGPEQHQAGILANANKFPEHQILFPSLNAGSTTFDPGDESFGFYAISPDHTIYSEDVWNILFYPTHASHAMRIYPLRDKNGLVINDAYLVCMEEAKNGDYNDYVFVVTNVTPIDLTDRFETLFNGTNFNGWYIWLQDKGRNNDPEKIFTIEQGGIVHDMGKELGYVMTEKSFGNFHFVLEFKWGEKRWPPRENSKRDSGICYNIPDDEPDSIWPQSVECQIQEGDVGDFWLLGFSTIQVDGKQNPPLNHSQIVKKKDGEKPHGEWNTVEVISFNGKCAHIVNGVLVNYGENSSLIGGKILLQSEYAEIFYRNIRLRSL